MSISARVYLIYFPKTSYSLLLEMGKILQYSRMTNTLYGCTDLVFLVSVILKLTTECACI